MFPLLDQTLSVNSKRARARKRRPPPKNPAIGDMAWFTELTGWDQFKGSRLCRKKLVPGSFNAQAGVRGSRWFFRKQITEAWFRNLITQ
jgi:hypothetical protein